MEDIERRAGSLAFTFDEVTLSLRDNQILMEEQTGNNRMW
jgi:hypothetical protein